MARRRSCPCSGGVITEEMSGTNEEAFISAIKLHVTANLAIIRAAEQELIKNKVGMHLSWRSLSATSTSSGCIVDAADSLTPLYSGMPAQGRTLQGCAARRYCA